jgi:hypothetical protein
MLMRTAKRIVAFLVSGCAPEKSFPSGNARVTNQVWALPRALATGVSAPVGLPFRSQAQQRVRKARPFEQLLSAPAAAHSVLFIRQPALSLNLHVNATTSGIDINAFLRGGKADYHTGLICHEGASFPTAKSHAAGARGTDIIMTVEILKML